VFARDTVPTVVSAAVKIAVVTRVENVAVALLPVDVPSVENARDVATLLLAPQCQLAAIKLSSTRSARFAHIAAFAPATELVVVSAVERIALATKVGSVGVGWEPVAPSVGSARVASI
jgi:hypothetical protein